MHPALVIPEVLELIFIFAANSYTKSSKVCIPTSRRIEGEDGEMINTGFSPGFGGRQGWGHDPTKVQYEQSFIEPWCNYRPVCRQWKKIIDKLTSTALAALTFRVKPTVKRDLLIPEFTVSPLSRLLDKSFPNKAFPGFDNPWMGSNAGRKVPCFELSQLPQY
ncbi:hypothetical protein H072_2458 [Dactylellina haptotyla CBS 200.50]|uniref:Uncharacterized protein n=1 Tax=Dactylellina haptotyla (strain CBS 200.50) TaxID=1284197 RepID=S8ARB0_DACHA|nr:hypothetical protein H072_2458 [Dactylellina haptotyla CBS 200.50]